MIIPIPSSSAARIVDFIYQLSAQLLGIVRRKGLGCQEVLLALARLAIQAVGKNCDAEQVQVSMGAVRS
jgi:hypothetical protein